MKSVNCNTAFAGISARTPAIFAAGSPLLAVLGCLRFFAACSEALSFRVLSSRDFTTTSPRDFRFRTAALRHIILYRSKARTLPDLDLAHRGPPCVLPYDIRGFPASLPCETYSPNRRRPKGFYSANNFYSFFIFS